MVDRLTSTDVARIMGMYGFAGSTVMEAWRSVDTKVGPNTGFVASLRPIAHSTALATVSGFAMQYTRKQVYELRGANPVLDDDEFTWFCSGVAGGATFLGGGYLFGGGAFFKHPHYIPGSAVPKGALLCGLGLAVVRALFGGSLRSADYEWRSAKRNPQVDAPMMHRYIAQVPQEAYHKPSAESNQQDLDKMKEWFEENRTYMSPSYRTEVQFNIARAEARARLPS